MPDKFLLSPHYIDRPIPAIRRIADSSWDLLPQSAPTGRNQQERLAALYPSFADWVAGTVGNGFRPVAVAGDCCTAVPMLAGLQRAGLDPYLIWLDAHGDFNTWETTPSGFMGGMPLAWLVGRGERTVPDSVGLLPLPEQDVLLTDARDLDPGERESVLESGITHLKSTPDLIEVPLPERPLWVHFDTDVINPVDAPAMNYLAPGGPTAGQLGKVFDYIAGTGRLQAVSVSAWNTDLDPVRQTESVVMGLVERLLGKG